MYSGSEHFLNKKTFCSLLLCFDKSTALTATRNLNQDKASAVSVATCTSYMRLIRTHSD